MNRGNDGFTLIEVVMSVALAMLLTSMAVVAFFNIRRLVNRAEVRLSMHASAQTTYNKMLRSFNSLQQTCAFVVYSTANSAPAGATPNDRVTLLFMRGKEDTFDFEYGSSAYFGQSYKSLMNSDLLWEQWTWEAATNTLYSSTNSPQRQFTGPNGFTIGGANYANQGFDVVPQPRRTLSIATARSWQQTLNDNQYFPDTSQPDLFKVQDNITDAYAYNVPSKASSSDVGDFEDLEYKLVPALTQMTAFSVQIVPQDNTVAHTILVNGAPGSTPNYSKVLNGVFLDGRMASALTAVPSYANSDLAQRPRIVRILFTLTDTTSKMTQNFSFSFPVGLAPTP